MGGKERKKIRIKVIKRRKRERARGKGIWENTMLLGFNIIFFTKAEISCSLKEMFLRRVIFIEQSTVSRPTVSDQALAFCFSCFPEEVASDLGEVLINVDTLCSQDVSLAHHTLS